MAELRQGRGGDRTPNPPRITWIRAGDRYPELADDLDHFIALDGEEEVGVVKLVLSPAGSEWMWSMLLTQGEVHKPRPRPKLNALRSRVRNRTR